MLAPFAVGDVTYPLARKGAYATEQVAGAISGRNLLYCNVLTSQHQQRTAQAPVFNFVQGDSRFIGFDARGSIRLAGRTWATLGLGYVDATLATNEALPRIPPLRGTLTLDLPYRGFTVSPRVMFANRQDNVFRGETETDGYVVADVRVSYVWPHQHTAHILTFTAHNLTDALYRNHTSFIKDLAPEMGRGFKVGYSLRFF